MTKLKIPIWSVDPFDWGVYADWLEENGDKSFGYIRRIAKALEYKPKAILSSSKYIPLKPTKHSRYWKKRRYRKLEWIINSKARPCYWTPADFPDLIEQRPKVAEAFFHLIVKHYGT